VTTQIDEWLTIRQAAERLGLSDLSVRRRIKDGRLAHRLIDGKYYVNLAAEAPGTGADVLEQSAPSASPDSNEYSGDQSASAVPAETSTNVSALLPALKDLAERAGRAAALESRLHQLETREAELQERLVALATRNGWLESKLDEREHAIKLLEDTQHRRRWWRRLFG